MRFLEEINKQVDLIDRGLMRKTAEEISDIKGRVYMFGNGGSASVVSHLAIDLLKNTSIRCHHFNSPETITCLANDFGYENWASACVDRYVTSEDYVILISSSGNSPNIVNAYESAISKRAKVLTLTGFSVGNRLQTIDSSCGFHVESQCYNVVETVHQIILLGIYELVVDKS